jgi:hypothetical protein
VECVTDDRGSYQSVPPRSSDRERERRVLAGVRLGEADGPIASRRYTIAIVGMFASRPARRAIHSEWFR